MITRASALPADQDVYVNVRWAAYYDCEQQHSNAIWSAPASDLRVSLAVADFVDVECYGGVVSQGSHTIPAREAE